MKVKVVYYSFLYQATGIKDELIELPEGTRVMELIHILINRYGKKLEDLLLDKETLNLNMLLVVNSKYVNDVQTCLNEGDEICFFNLVAGG